VNLFGRDQEASFTATSEDRPIDRLQVETGTTVKAIECPPIATWIGLQKVGSGVKSSENSTTASQMIQCPHIDRNGLCRLAD
jgi:hypothetical protein